jgi:GNAT superfamily N-acetyltransferase
VNKDQSEAEPSSVPLGTVIAESSHGTADPSERIEIRALVADDIDGAAGFADLRRGVIDELAQERGGALFLAQRSDRTAAELLHTPTGTNSAELKDPSFLRGAFIDSALLGWVYVVVTTMPDRRKLGCIEELGVHADARQLGIGEALLNVSLEYCREQGCVGVDSFALPGARETKNFFETFGMKARLLTVHVRLAATEI